MEEEEENEEDKRRRRLDAHRDGVRRRHSAAVCISICFNVQQNTRVYSPASFCMMHAANGNEPPLPFLSLSLFHSVPPLSLLTSLSGPRRGAYIRLRYPLLSLSTPFLPHRFPTGKEDMSHPGRGIEGIRELNIAPSSCAILPRL